MNEEMREAQRKQFSEWAAEPPNRYDVEKFNENYDFLIKLDQFHVFTWRTTEELYKLEHERKENKK